MDDLISRQSAIDAIMGEPTDAHYPSWYAERLEQLPSVTEYTQKEKETAEQASENKTFYVTEFLTRICNQINEYHKNGKTEQIETLKWVVEQVQEIYGIYIKSKYDVPMTEKEIAYCENDVLIMQEILK